MEPEVYARRQREALGRIGDDGGSPARLARVFQVEDSLRYRPWKFDEQEMALVVKIVLAAFIHDAHQVILGGSRIRNDPVDLA